MASPCDPATRGKILEAVQASDGARHLRWTPQAEENLNRESRGVVQVFAVNKALRIWVENRGFIKAVTEQRERWKSQHEFHFDVEFPLGRYSVYLEMRLVDDSRERPELFIVSSHCKPRGGSK